MSSVRSNVKKTSSSSKASASTKTSSGMGSSGISKKDTGASGSVADRKGRDQFLKYVKICEHVYDYKDDQKDTQGKNDRLNAIKEILNLIGD